MNIVLSTSPHLKHASVLDADFHPRNDLMYSFAPLGLLMLCSVIREKFNTTPVIYDINKQINGNEIPNSDEFYTAAARSIAKLQPDVLGFMTECDSYHHVLQICRELKQLIPDCYIILGGPHATAVAQPTLEKWPCIDCIVLGEGEQTFTDIIHSLINHSNQLIPGTIMRDQNKKVVTGEPRSLISSLDDLPFPAYDLYQPAPGEELFLEVGRGCPFQCTFCSTSPFWERKHRTKSPARIVDEILHIRSFHTVERVHFTHDLFTANTHWAAEVCQALIQADLKIRWTCSSRIDTISEPLMALMAQAGCDAIFFGIESGSERILKLIQKDIPLQQTLDTIRLCTNYGITPNGGLIVGFPGEDRDSFLDTFNVYHTLLQSGMKPLHIFSYCPFAQSSMYSSLSNIHCSGHFMDIPLPAGLDSSNRALIQSDAELFGSFYKPVLTAIPALRPGMLYGVDEFALLVDTVKIPALAVTEKTGGLSNLFFQWIDYIEEINQASQKQEYRRFMGSPIDFCNFLLTITGSIAGIIDEYIETLLLVLKKNFEVTKQLTYINPTSMATYRSKVIPPQLTEVHSSSTFTIHNVLHAMKIDYDVSALIKNVLPPAGYIPEKRTVNLIWHSTEDNNASLVEVNDFLYALLTQPSEQKLSVNRLIETYIKKAETMQAEVNLAEILSDLRSAQEKQLIQIN